MYKEFLQYNKKIKDQVLKGQRLEQVFLQIRYANCEKAHGKITNMLAIRGNGNQNHNEISHYIHIYNQKMKNNKSAEDTETQETSLPLLFPLLLAIFQGFK